MRKLIGLLAVLMSLTLVNCGDEDGVNETPTPDNGKKQDLPGTTDIVDTPKDLVPETQPEDKNTDPEPEVWFEWMGTPDEVSPPDKDVVEPWDLPGGPDLKDALTDPEDTGTKIKDLQNSPDSLECVVLFGSMLVGLDIELSNVVVTAPPYHYMVAGTKLDGFYVADQDGGFFSGIHVTYPTAQVPDLVPGQVLTLVGDHKEAFCQSIFSAKSILIEQDQGPEPEPLFVSPEQIVEDPEQLEGVLVIIKSVTVTSANPDASEGYDKQEFEVNGILRVGNDYGVKYMSPGTDARKEGDQFAQIVGVIKFADEKWHLMPRYDSDMLKEGETPPEPEPEIVEQPAIEIEPDIVQPPEPEPEIIEQPDTWEVVEPDIVAPDDMDILEEELPPVEDVLQLDVPQDPDSPIVIVEIMYDPAGIPDDKGEWLEIFNASDEPYDINGWRLEGDDGKMHFIMNGGPFIMEPGDFLVLGSNSIESTNGGVEIDYQFPYVDFSMDNTVDAVLLKNIYGETVDEVYYDEKGGWPTAKGASMELLHPYLDNDNPANWKLATEPYGEEGKNLGTPGTGPLP